MDTIKYLLSAILKIAFVVFLGAIMLWLVGLFYPEFKPSNILSSATFSGDWLPAPKNYAGLLGTPSKDGNYGTVYTPGTPYNGYSNSNSYTNSSNNVNDNVFTGNTSSYSEKSLYIRNLSVYEGGPISPSMSFVGEARDTMFKNGIFPIAVIDRTGQLLGWAQGINTGTWAAPGWARFQAQIPNGLPHALDCALVFYSANQPIKVGMAVRCN